MVTSTASLFACSAADVTIERVRELVGQDPPESLTLEFKERYSSGVVKSIAAMANTYGGLILVGVTDQPGPNRIPGVPDSAVVQIANACHEALEPPWQPEIITVPLEQSPGLFVVVIRVDPVRAPRPLLVSGAAPVRLQGRNATADRARLGQLFGESATPMRSASRRLNPPSLPTDADGTPTADFVVRTGAVVPVDEAATWRPLSERAVSLLAEALNGSPLQTRMLRWCTEMGINGFTPFKRSGYNRARHARLVWSGAVRAAALHPVEAIAVAELPDSYGTPASTLQFTLDVIIRATAYLEALSPSGMPTVFRLAVPDLYTTVEAMLAGLADQPVIDALAGLAGIDPVLVPLPTNLHLVTGPAVGDLLYPEGLVPIPDAGPSHGANLLANPTLDLGVPEDRKTQLDDWLQQIALDAGLSGMEALVAVYHQAP
jgi:Putative DNA-binding domain